MQKLFWQFVTLCCCTLTEMCRQLEAEHSIECITDTDHSIALSKTVLCGYVIARRDDHARPSSSVTIQPQRDAWLSRRNVMHFVTLWPLTFWPNIHWWTRYCDGLSLCQVWRYGFKPFWFYRADRHRQTRQNHIITEADDRYTDSTTVGISH